MIPHYFVGLTSFKMHREQNNVGASCLGLAFRLILSDVHVIYPNWTTTDFMQNCRVENCISACWILVPEKSTTQIRLQGR